MEMWRTIPFNKSISMSDAFHQYVVDQHRSSVAKLVSLYGIGEDSLQRVYTLNLSHVDPCHCGSYSFERSSTVSNFILLLFHIGFDKSENWESFVKNINKVPLIPQSFNEIRDQQIPNINRIDRRLIKSTSLRSRHNKNRFTPSSSSSLNTKIKQKSSNNSLLIIYNSFFFNFSS
jgi:hypothetical protein